MKLTGNDISRALDKLCDECEVRTMPRDFGSGLCTDCKVYCLMAVVETIPEFDSVRG